MDVVGAEGVGGQRDAESSEPHPPILWGAGPRWGAPREEVPEGRGLQEGTRPGAGQVPTAGRGPPSVGVWGAVPSCPLFSSRGGAALRTEPGQGRRAHLRPGGPAVGPVRVPRTQVGLGRAAGATDAFSKRLPGAFPPGSGVLRSPGAGSGPAASTRERQVWRLFPDRVGTRGEPRGHLGPRSARRPPPSRGLGSPVTRGARCQTRTRTRTGPNLPGAVTHTGVGGAGGAGGAGAAGPPLPPLRCLPSLPPPLPPPRRGRGRCSRAPAPPRPHKGPSPWQPRGPERSAERGPGAIESCRLTSRYEMGCRARGAAARGGGLRRELLRPGLERSGRGGPGQRPPRGGWPGLGRRPVPIGLGRAARTPVSRRRSRLRRPGPGLAQPTVPAGRSAPSCRPRLWSPSLRPGSEPPPTAAPRRPVPAPSRPAWFRRKPGFPRGPTCAGLGPTAPGPREEDSGRAGPGRVQVPTWDRRPSPASGARALRGQFPLWVLVRRWVNTLGPGKPRTRAGGVGSELGAGTHPLAPHLRRLLLGDPLG